MGNIQRLTRDGIVGIVAFDGFNTKSDKNRQNRQHKKRNEMSTTIHATAESYDTLTAQDSTERPVSSPLSGVSESS